VRLEPLIYKTPEKFIIFSVLLRNKENSRKAHIKKYPKKISFLYRFKCVLKRFILNTKDFPFNEAFRLSKGLKEST
jgi:hypothetical protein